MSAPHLRMDPGLLHAAMAFAWGEADLLDQRRYEDWLDLWTDDGLYIVPIAAEAESFEDQLNYVYDDARMRRARVERLRSRHSISAVAAARTVRASSRFVLLDGGPATLAFRCAQHLVETKRGADRLYAADVTYELAKCDGGYRMTRKIVRLLNATDALGGVAYLF